MVRQKSAVRSHVDSIVRAKYGSLCELLELNLEGKSIV